MSKIKILAMDVDGTLTDGKIYVGAQGEIMKAFNVKDGYGIAQLLPKMSITPVIITGRKSEIVSRRAEELKIKHVYQGVTDKLNKLSDIASEFCVSLENVAYIGDDLNDIDCIEHCGLTACPADSVNEVMRMVDYICPSCGGDGAVREFIEYIAEINERDN